MRKCREHHGRAPMVSRRSVMGAMAALAVSTRLPARSLGVPRQAYPPLLGPRQAALELRAMGIWESAAMQAARADATDLWAQDHDAVDAEARALAAPAVDELAMVSVIDSLCDYDHPELIWVHQKAHAIGGRRITGTRYAIDNSDNIYGTIALDGQSSYVLSGRFEGGRPADFTISLLEYVMFHGGDGKTIASLAMKDLAIASDGTFTVRIVPDPQPGEMRVTGAVQARTRCTLSDWAAQSPPRLSIRRLDGPRQKSPEDADIARAAAALLRERATRLRTFKRAVYERAPLNQLTLPRPSGPVGGLPSQMASNGIFRLADDEALIVSCDLVDADYVAVQISDPWMVSYNYWTRLSSLTHKQVEILEPGRMSVVISPQDPGVRNWLDPSGHHAGCFTIRWQNLKSGPDQKARVDCRVVNVDAVREALPAGTASFSARARTMQRAERARSYNQRFAASVNSYDPMV